MQKEIPLEGHTTPPTITVYSTPQCKFCKELRVFLLEAGLPFREYNVLHKPDRLEELKRVTRGSQSVPVLVINKDLPDQKVFIGFAPEMIRLTLKFFPELPLLSHSLQHPYP